jgi:hypothetical protein
MIGVVQYGHHACRQFRGVKLLDAVSETGGGVYPDGYTTQRCPHYASNTHSNVDAMEVHGHLHLPPQHREGRKEVSRWRGLTSRLGPLDRGLVRQTPS